MSDEIQKLQSELTELKTRLEAFFDSRPADIRKAWKDSLPKPPQEVIVEPGRELTGDEIFFEQARKCLNVYKSIPPQWEQEK
jgi:hypothetical protein